MLGLVPIKGRSETSEICPFMEQAGSLMRVFLDFEKPVADLEGKIEELRHLSNDGDINIAEEVGKLKLKVERQLRNTYQKLSPWQKFRSRGTLIARISKMLSARL